MKDPPPVAIPGDETKLTWAISNLLANALRYTPEGGRVAVYFEAASVIVSLTLLGQVLELRARSQTSATPRAPP